MTIIIISLIVLLVNFSLISNFFKVNEIVLDNVKLKDSEPSNNGFALMLQKYDGTYEQSDSSTWPNGMEFNSELSGCIDVNGNKIDGSLTYDNNLVTVSTNKTSYCYVYFDIKPTLANQLIKISSDELWKSTLENDGYRYVGTNPNNYICFGTSDMSTCTSDTDKYMYRIIGIFEDSSGSKHVKLIKKEALNTVYSWNSDYQTDVDWNESDLYKGINGSYFLTNTSYTYMQDSSWTDKIATWTYTMTNAKTWENYDSTGTYGPYYNDNTNKVVYLHELNRNGKSSEICYYESDIIADCNVGEWKKLETKISLMYASDYALSLGEIALNYTGTNNYSTMKTGWLHISNNDSETPSSYEWTMSRLGYYSNGVYSMWTVRSDGLVDWYYVSNSFAACPVFYLESNVELLDNSNEGTITNPYLIKQ